MCTHLKTTSSWKDKRIEAMNKIIKQNHYKTEALIEEYNRVSNSKAENKKQYKGESNANS
jgi:hypothetical protein